jgi:hypothetical protein
MSKPELCLVLEKLLFVFLVLRHEATNSVITLNSSVSRISEGSPLPAFNSFLSSATSTHHTHEINPIIQIRQMAKGKQSLIKDILINGLRRKDDQSELLQLVPKPPVEFP